MAPNVTSYIQITTNKCWFVFIILIALPGAKLERCCQYQVCNHSIDNGIQVLPLRLMLAKHEFALQLIHTHITRSVILWVSLSRLLCMYNNSSCAPRECRKCGHPCNVRTFPFPTNNDDVVFTMPS